MTGSQSHTLKVHAPLSNRNHRIGDGKAGSHVGGAQDADPGEPRRNHGAGRRGAPPVGLQGGRRRPARHPHQPRLPHPPPLPGSDLLLPSRSLHGRQLRPHARHSPRGLPLGRRHLPRRHLQHLSPGGDVQSSGIGLALVIPSIQSLIADSSDDGNRGTAFGWFQVAGSFGSIIGGFGSIIGGFVAILLASTSFMGVAGWRVAFHLVAILSVLIGALMPLYTVDPHFVRDDASGAKPAPRNSMWIEMKDLFREAKAVARIPSFQIIIAQGVAGSFPWSALSFAPMWLELVGFSHKDTGLLMTLFTVATSLGGLFGGTMGDFLAGRFPNAGRIVLSQISSGSCIPLAAVLLLALPDDPSTGLAHALVLFIMGLTISWNASATNNPIFAEIVQERSRTSIYALDRSFESMLAAFATPVVGILAERVYGYKPIAAGDESTHSDRGNAASLAKVLYTAIAIPISLCCVIYSFLYCTYPRDRERARMESLMASELQQMELQSCHQEEKFYDSEQGGRGSLDNVGCGTEDFGHEDCDEETLLSK